MKINSTASLTIQIDSDLHPTPASPDLPITGANGFAVALFIHRPPHDNASPLAAQPALRAPAHNHSGALSPHLDAVYRCKNCGKRMKLSEAANYYGLPACPTCVQACAPFEIVPESPDSNSTHSSL